MITKQLVSGRPAVVAYFRDNFVPVAKDEATMAKVVFEDDKSPSSVFLRFDPSPAPASLVKYNENHDEQGRFSSSDDHASTIARVRGELDQRYFSGQRPAARTLTELFYKHSPELQRAKAETETARAAHGVVSGVSPEASRTPKAIELEAAHDAAKKREGVVVREIRAAYNKAHPDWLKSGLVKFNPDEPRDDHGMWTSGGEGASVKVPGKYSGLPPKVMQDEKLNSWEKLTAASAVAKQQMENWLDKDKGLVAQEGGVHVDRFPKTKEGWDRLKADSQGKPVLALGDLKGIGRSADKIKEEYGGKWNGLLDVARASVALDTPKDVQNFLNKLESSGMELARAPKDRFNAPVQGGYRGDFLLNPRMPNGTIVELQVGIKGLFEAKSLGGHDVYDKVRKIEGRYPPNTSPENMTTADRTALAGHKATMAALYNKAWNDSLTAPHGTGMGKVSPKVEYVDYNDTIYRVIDGTAKHYWDGSKWVDNDRHYSSDIFYNGYPAENPEGKTELLKFNPNHQPGGQSIGGQFAPKDSTVAGQALAGVHTSGLTHTQMFNLALDHDALTAYKGFPRAAQTEESKQIEDRSIYKYLTDREGLMKQYYDKNGNKVSNADNMRKLFEGYTGHNSEAVHEASSALSKDIWRNNLETNPEKEAWLYAGGSGSGKTSSIETMVPGIMDRAAAVMDFNMTTYKSAMQRIEEARGAGKFAQIAYVYRDSTTAWEDGVIKRMLTNPNEEGRVVPMSAFIHNTIGSLDTVRRMKAEGVPVTAIDNGNGKGSRGIMSDAKLASLSHPSAAAMKSTLTEVTNQIYRDGYVNSKDGKTYRMTSEQYHALLQ